MLFVICSVQDAHQGEGAYCGIDRACRRGQDEGDLIKKDRHTTVTNSLPCEFQFLGELAE